MAETKEQEQSINEENPQDKSVAFFAGRANPPTPGHIKIMIQMLEFARNNDMIPRIYLSSSYNKADKPIDYITKKSSDSNLRKVPFYTHVKHKKYENPLMPDEKKNFVVEMLHNATGMDREKLEEIVVVSLQCKPLYFALSCVNALQPNIDKVFYFMGREKDNNEREQREKNCFSISENDGETFDETGRLGGRYKCILVSREDDPGNPAAGMSGSKIRLLVAGAWQKEKRAAERETEQSAKNEKEREAAALEANARAELQKVYKGLLKPEQINDLFDRIEKGTLRPTERTKISDKDYPLQFKTNPSSKIEDVINQQEQKQEEEQEQEHKRKIEDVTEPQVSPPSSRIRVVPPTAGGRKTRRKKRKGKKKTYKRKHKKNKTKRKIKRKRKKNLKKRTKKR